MKRYGFTLIELLIVIAILAILSAMITGNFLTSLKKGRDAKRKADLENIQKALEMYYEDVKAYPTPASTQSKLLTSLTDVVSTKIYMQVIPNDPVTGKYYQYDSSSPYQSYQLYACLENTEQILPYVSTGGTIDCSSINCKNPSLTPVPCKYGISSPNTQP
jgi:type II secretion system protein G